MPAKKLLITGAKGQLGSDLVRLLARSYTVIGSDFDDLDITDEQAIETRIAQVAPDVVIHAAAFTNVDACESEEETAKRVNADATLYIARACRRHDARMIYFSTDYVFDGTKSTAYVETDRPHPQTAYGRTKLAGELFMQDELVDCAVLRIAWLYGAHGNNFVKTMLGLARKQSETKNAGGSVSPLTVVDDQYGGPTCTEAVVRQTERIIERGLSGVYHATSQGETTWYGFACEIFKQAGIDVDIEPCTTEQFPRPAPRPKRSTLENAALRDAGADIMPHWQESLERFISVYKEQL